LERIVASMAQAARQAGVPIVTADTKVVERGKGDGIFITTTGVGVQPAGRELGGALARPGDAILVSGTIGDHGVAIMSQRESLSFEAPIVSDTAALHGLVAALLDSGVEVHALRDPTRGGLAATLNEIAVQANVGMLLDEAAIPIHPSVAAACEFLGLARSALRGQGGQAGLHLCAGRRPAGARRAARPPARRPGSDHRRCRRRRASLRAAKYDPRRPAHRRLAGQRSAPAHLLRKR
jgi:hydrogenase expression/formation protein HypE